MTCQPTTEVSPSSPGCSASRRSGDLGGLDEADRGLGGHAHVLVAGHAVGLAQRDRGQGMGVHLLRAPAERSPSGFWCRTSQIKPCDDAGGACRWSCAFRRARRATVPSPWPRRRRRRCRARSNCRRCNALLIVLEAPVAFGRVDAVPATPGPAARHIPYTVVRRCRRGSKAWLPCPGPRPGPRSPIAVHVIRMSPTPPGPRIWAPGPVAMTLKAPRFLFTFPA